MGAHRVTDEAPAAGLHTAAAVAEADETHGSIAGAQIALDISSARRALREDPPNPGKARAYALIAIAELLFASQ